MSGGCTVLDKYMVKGAKIFVGVVGMLAWFNAWSAYFYEDGKWESSGKFVNVPVCIINDGRIHEDVKNGVYINVLRNAVTNTWEAYSGVRFRDWSDCWNLPEHKKSEYVGIYIAGDSVDASCSSESQNGSTEGHLGAHIGKGDDNKACEIGKRVKGKVTKDDPGVILDPYGADFIPDRLCRTHQWGWKWPPWPEDHSFDCLEQYGIHEFGHVLGFVHEMDRPDKPKTCTTGYNDTPNDYTPIRPLAKKRPENCETAEQYDCRSIMAYWEGCIIREEGSVRFGTKTLSPTDVQAVKEIYPRPPCAEFIEDHEFNVENCSNISMENIDGHAGDDVVCQYNISGNSTVMALKSGTQPAIWKRVSGCSGRDTFHDEKCEATLFADLGDDDVSDMLCTYDFGHASTQTFVRHSKTSGEFSAWEPWGMKSGRDKFNIGSCAEIHSADVNGDGLDDLICPYDYGDASTATRVQFSDDSLKGTYWLPWGSKTGKEKFYIRHSRVSRDPLRYAGCKSTYVGYINDDESADLICPYDYNTRGTRTYVLISETNDKGIVDPTDWQQWGERTEVSQFNINACYTILATDISANGKTDLVCPANLGSSGSVTYVQSGSYRSGGRYTGDQWTRWSPSESKSSINPEMCRKFISEDMNNDGMSDLVCLYDYTSGKTATFVQFARDPEDGAYKGTSWRTWSKPSGRDFVNLDLCRYIGSGYINDDEYPDLVCVYHDASSSDPRTFVQLSRSDGEAGTQWTDW
jgi:hypothetical protein